jgi:hypothetical protein
MNKARVQFGGVRLCQWNDRDSSHHEICIMNPAREDIKDRLRLNDDLCFDRTRDPGNFLNFESVDLHRRSATS